MNYACRDIKEEFEMMEMYHQINVKIAIEARKGNSTCPFTFIKNYYVSNICANSISTHRNRNSRCKNIQHAQFLTEMHHWQCDCLSNCIWRITFATWPQWYIFGDSTRGWTSWYIDFLTIMSIAIIYLSGSKLY